MKAILQRLRGVARLIFAATLLLGACKDMTHLEPEGLKRICPSEGVIAPAPSSPGHGSIVTELLPSFEWTYGDDCLPEGYRVEVTDYGGYIDAGTIAGATTDGNTSWVPSGTLQPASDYEWRVAAVNGSAVGPYSTSIRFWTGPVCEPASLQPPTPAFPLDGAQVDSAFPPMSWSYPDPCVPESFAVHLTTDPGFAGANLVADFNSPAKAVIPAVPLIDCTTYYWRVVARSGGLSGPASPTRSFQTSLGGACANPTFTHPPPIPAEPTARAG